MRVGIGLPMTTPGVTGAQLVAWSRRAEELGFSALATTDHVVYPGLDPLTPLAAAAAVTSRIELLTFMVVAPLRDPVLLAKQAAAIDILSDGRLTLGVTVGWRPADFEATGRPLDGRGERFEQGLRTMRACWAGDESVAHTSVCPPLRRGTIPVVVGGSARLAAPRVATLGDGWGAGLIPSDQLPGEVELVTGAWRSAGRPGRPRTLACRQVALGSAATAAAGGYIDRYYDEPDAAVRDQFADDVLPSADALRADLAACEAAGIDTVVLFAFGDRIDELDLIASAAL